MKFDQSPNYTKGRPIGVNFKPIKPSYLIIHAMSGSYLGSISWFKNPKSKVSAHYLISQKGEVTQMVGEEHTAWHCYGLNGKSIGIELEDGKPGACMKDATWIKYPMYQKAVELAADITTRYSIPIKNIMGHNDPFVRAMGIAKGFAHSDPGPYFDMVKFRKDVEACIAQKKTKNSMKS